MKLEKKLVFLRSNPVLHDETSEDLITDMILPSTDGPFYTFIMDKKEDIIRSLEETTQLSRNELFPFLCQSWVKMYATLPNPFEDKALVKKNSFFTCLPNFFYEKKTRVNKKIFFVSTHNIFFIVRNYKKK